MACPDNPRGCSRVQHTLILLRAVMEDGLGMCGCRVSRCAATLLPHEPSCHPAQTAGGWIQLAQQNQPGRGATSDPGLVLGMPRQGGNDTAFSFPGVPGCLCLGLAQAPQV